MAAKIKDGLFIFNNKYENLSPSVANKYDCEAFRNLREKNYGVFVVSKINITNLPPFLILPNDFRDRLNNFIEVNNKKISSILNIYDINQNNVYVFLSYALCQDSINYFIWILKCLINGAPVRMIFSIMMWVEKNSHMINQVSKGTITAYNVSELFKLMTELDAIRSNKRVKNSIMEFNTSQKKILKENCKTKEDLDCLNKFGRLSESKRLNFIKKMSTIDDYNEIMHQMGNLCEVHFKWNKESFLEYISNSSHVKADIVVDKGNFLILKINDYDTIKRLTKSTNWCITKNKMYWNNYVGSIGSNHQQYVIFDFNLKEDDEYSIVGFTVKDGMIFAAHSFTNQDINFFSEKKFNSFISSNARYGIYELFEKNGISTDFFSENLKFHFKWEKEALLNEITKDDFAYVVYNKNNLVGIIFNNDKNISNYFPYSNNNRKINNLSSHKILSFYDFSKNVSDRNCLISFVIDENEFAGTEFSSRTMNASLMEVSISLSEYLYSNDIPFDIIKRKENFLSIFKAILGSFNINVINKLLKNKNFVNVLKKNKKENVFISSNISHGITNLCTFDVINVFYENGIKISELVTSNMLHNLIYHILQYINNKTRVAPFEPSEDIINSFACGEIKNVDLICNIGWFLSLKKIIIEEKNDSINEWILTNIRSFNSINKPLVDEIIRLAIENSDLSCSKIESAIRRLASSSDKFKWIKGVVAFNESI